jgi:aerobic-type carbon monoxide dehydrogenase small subunit (CoxS/CutS family)
VVTTIAGLTPENGLSDLQASFVASGAIQCGYCTPGQIVAATALLSRDPHPSRTVIGEWMAGNLCRCTGYEAIIDAISAAADGPTAAGGAG